MILLFLLLLIFFLYDLKKLGFLRSILFLIYSGIDVSGIKSGNLCILYEFDFDMGNSIKQNIFGIK